MPMLFLHVRRIGWRLLLSGMTLPVLLCAMQTHAATTYNERYAPVAPLKIVNQGGEVGIEYNYLREEQKQEFTNVEFVNSSLEEYILHCLRGYVYHPRFVDFQTKVKLGLLQQSLERTGDFPYGNDDDAGGDFNTDVNEYDLQVQILKEHPLSFDVQANRQRDIVRQLFTDRYLIESESAGGGVHWKPGPVPMDLSVRESQFREFGTDSYSESNLSVLEYRARNEISRRIRSELLYRHQDYDQSFEAELPLYDTDRQTTVQSDDISLSNTIDFTENGRNSLYSLLRGYDQTGTQEFSNTYWQERLNLQHRPHLRSYYQFSLLQDQLDRAETESRRFEIGAEHQLYESLLSHIDYHVRENDYMDASQEESGVTTRWDYRKHTPAGQLSLGYSQTIDQIQRSGFSRLRTIIDDPLTFESVALIHFLREPNVIASSINVTDLSGLVSYVEGFDYEVEVRGNITGLRRLIGGRINVGDTVLVDYVTEATPEVDYNTHSRSFNARYDFERYLPGVSIYHRQHNLDTSGDIPDDDRSVLTYDSWLNGFSYDWRQLTWIEEYEQYESNFTNWTQLRHELSGRHPINANLLWGWRTGLLKVDYDDDDADVNSHDVLFSGINLRGSRPGWGFWDIEAQARKETGMIDETLFGVIGRNEFYWRRLRFNLGGRLEQRERFDTERNRMAVFFQVAWEF